MERLFIVDNTSTFKQNTRIEDLKNHEIAAFGMALHSGVLEQYNLGTPYEFIQFYSGASRQDSGVISVNTDKWRTFRKVPYSEPIASTWRASFTNDKVGYKDEFEVKIAILDNENETYAKNESYSVFSHGRSKLELYKDLAKQISQSKYFDAGYDEAGVLITALSSVPHEISVGGRFNKNVSDCPTCESSEVIGTQVARYAAGSGSWQQVRELDRLYLASRGDLSDDWDMKAPRPSVYGDGFTDAQKENAKFDLFHLEYANPISAGGDQGRENFEMRHVFTVAIHKDNTDAQGLYTKVIKDALGLTLQVSPLQ